MKSPLDAACHTNVELFVEGNGALKGHKELEPNPLGAPDLLPLHAANIPFTTRLTVTRGKIARKIDVYSRKCFSPGQGLSAPGWYLLAGREHEAAAAQAHAFCQPAGAGDNYLRHQALPPRSHTVVAAIRTL